MESLKKALNKQELISQLKNIGLKQGMTVEVHSSFKSVGYVIGGPEVLNDALIESVGEDGTIVMAYQNSYNTEPLNWENPPIDLSLVEKVRNNMPGYDINTTSCAHMGALVENLHNRNLTYHSQHPNCAFIAYGKNGKFITSNQTLNFPLSDSSPLGREYELDGYCLLIGVGYNNATCMHLGEFRSAVRSIVMNGGAVKIDNQNVWRKYLEIEYDSDEFVEIGKELEKKKIVKVSKLGEATVRFFSIREVVDFTEQYLKKKYN